LDVIIIMPILFDLALDENGGVILGPGTKKACDQAIEIARHSRYALILTTATVPTSAKWKGERMGLIAQRYIVTANSDARVDFAEAETFDTFGEVLAVARYVRYLPSVEKVVLTVKWWHAPRVFMLARRIFRRLDISCPIELRIHSLRVTPKGLLGELLGFVKNWRRVSHLN
jgi:hypothetical protein